MEYQRPADIERASMEIISEELEARGVTLSESVEAVVKRVIHTTADFDFVETLRFSPDAVEAGSAAVRGGTIVTDTNMALSGVSKPALRRLGAEAYCFMAEEFIAARAKERQTTRAAASMEYAMEHYPGAALAVGNAPTALLEIAARIEAGARPALVIGVPVGFVNVSESKERIWEVCRREGVPVIAAMGRKGGSPVAAAICNALLYTAAELLEPETRMG